MGDLTVGPNDSLVAKIRTFKPSGKWYDEFEIVVPGVIIETPLFQIWDIIKSMYTKESYKGWFIEVVSVPDHSHDHPTLLKL